MAGIDSRIREAGTEALVIEQGGRTRLLFFIIFLLLTVMVFTSIDFSYDFSPERIGGTLFTFALILVSLGVSLFVRSFKIDKSEGLLTRNAGLPFGIYRKEIKTYRLGTKARFIVRSADNAFKDGKNGRKFFTFSIGAAVAGRRLKTSLYIETENNTVLICDSTSREEIIQKADYMSAYLGFSVKTGD